MADKAGMRWAPKTDREPASSGAILGTPPLPKPSQRRAADRRRLSLHLSTALASVLCLGTGLQPAQAQSVATTGDVFPSGATSPDWSIADLLYVGIGGHATLTIENGGTVSNTHGSIGFGSGSTGTVTVSGTDADGNASTWTNTGNLYVGEGGSGMLTVVDGGRVSNSFGWIGAYPGSIGTVTVSGTDAGGNASTWTNSNDLTVGWSGNGTLAVEGGGRVSNRHGAIGTGLDSTSAVTVSGTDANGNASTWTNTGNLSVGGNGNGTLTVEDGGRVEASQVIFGLSGGGTGTLNLLGSTAGGRGVLETGGVSKGLGAAVLNLDGGILRATGNESNFLRDLGVLTVGSEGAWFDSNGYDITVGPGTTFSSAPSSSFNKIGLGTLTLTGDSSGFAGIARIDGGTLEIAQGGKLGGSTGYIGYDTGSTGAVTVSGTDGSGNASTWTNSGNLFVGNAGSGTLTVEDGGTVTNTSGAAGDQAGSEGTVIVTGEGSTWTNDSGLHVGNAGTGTLTVEDGGRVSNGYATVGYYSGSTGAVTVSGTDGNGNASTWDNASFLTVGYLGSGTLTIAESGAVSNTFGNIGQFSGSEGTATVTGDGSTWTNSGDLAVGVFGSGTLTVAEGGAVSNAIGYVGRSSDAEGTATVTGDGSTWTNSSSLTVGVNGAGTLTVADGGAITNTIGYIGEFYGAEGIVTVTGEGSTWTNDGGLTVGNAGTGTLIIEEGGAVDNTFGYIGFAASSEGTVIVTGDGSTWTNSSGLRVGAFGTGTLTVSDGGIVSAGDGAGGPETVYLGQNAIGEGTINIGAAAGAAAIAAGTIEAASLQFGAGVGTLSFNHSGETVFSAALVSVGSGTHALDHHAGITTLTGHSSTFTGTTTVSGGALVVADALGGSAFVTGGRLEVDGTFGGDVAARDTGVVSGAGTIAGDVTFTSGGVLAGAQGETLTIDGDLTLDTGSSVDVALGGAPSDALFSVGGDLGLDGTLNVADAGGFGMGVYRLFDYDGSLSGGGLLLGDRPGGVQADDLFVQTAVGGQVNLISTTGAELGFWDGGDTALHDDNAIDGGAGVWEAGGRNWTDAAGALNGPYQPNPTFAVFQGAASTVSVDDGAGDIAVVGMQFTTDGYIVEGDVIALEGMGESIIRVGAGSAADAGMTATIASSLTGDSRLVKTDLGTLILSGSNSYLGGTELRAGTLSVSADANLGDVAGGLAFTGGTLSTTASFISDRAVTLDATGYFEVAGATELGLSGSITGTGDLFKTGAGTLVLSGANGYGNTLVEAGTLTGGASSISGSIGNAATVVFDQGNDASFIGDIVGLDGTNGTMVKQGAGMLALDGLSTLDWTITEGGLATDAARFGGDALLDGVGTTLSFADAGTSLYAGVISGNGQFSVNGAGAVLLTGDSSRFAGRTVVNAGRLLVGDTADNGALGGSLDVMGGATLGGAGTIGSGPGSMVTIASGGTLSPGNSIGTLMVDGDLTFEAGSHFAVEVNPEGNESDLVTVTGNATLNGGAVAHIGGDGNYNLRSTYTILTADGTLSGAFDTVTSDFAFLTPGLIYDYGAGTVGLDLTRNDIDFASVALTRNQIATAGGIDSIGIDAGHPVYDAIARLPGDADLIRASFDALSGEIHGSARTALIEDSRFVRNAANDRIRAAFADVGASAAPVLAYGPDDKPMAVAADHAGPVFWSHGFGSWGSTDSDGNAASLDRNTGGLLIGADGLVGDWRIGLLAGYSHSSFDADDRASSGSSDNYHLGLYSGTQWGKLAFRSGLAYTWHDIDANRSVAIPGLADSLSANYDAATFQAFGELGYGMEAKGFRFEPFANLAYVSLHTDGSTEQGGPASLSVSGGNTDVTFTTLGLRAEHGLALGSVDAKLKGMIGWRHAFGDTTPESTHAFSAGDAFTIAGVPIARNAAVIEAGLDLNITPDAAFGLSYTGQIASDAQDHGFNATLAVRF